ncbi:MAG: hypothetical protein M3552_19055 [Planctomycetota bacterium]|nr:hypothetical protein [Planctomycetota bacterium]
MKPPLEKLRERLSEKGFKLNVTDEAKKLLIDKSDDVNYGAWPLRRAITQYIEYPLSEELMKGSFDGYSQITVELKTIGDQEQFEYVPGTADGE